MTVVVNNPFVLPKHRANYVGVFEQRWNKATQQQDCVKIFFRDQYNVRRVEVFKDPKNLYYYYEEDENGIFTSMTGESCTKLAFTSKFSFKDAIASCAVRKFETDLTITDRVLLDHYFGLPTPKIQYALLDIECDVKLKAPEKFDENIVLKVRKKS